MDLDRRTLMKLMSVGALSPIGVAEAQDSDPTRDTSEGTEELQKQTCIYQRPEEERSEIDAPANCNLQLVDPARGNTYYSPFGIKGWYESGDLEVANGRLRLAEEYQTAPFPNIVSQWRVDDRNNSTVEDIVGNNDGTAATTNVSGNYIADRAEENSGANTVDCGLASFGNKIDQDFSVAFTIDDFTSNSRKEPFGGGDRDGSVARFVVFFGQVNSGDVTFGVRGDNTGTIRIATSSGSLINDGNKHRVVCEKNANTGSDAMRIWVDGTEQSTQVDKDSGGPSSVSEFPDPVAFFPEFFTDGHLTGRLDNVVLTEGTVTQSEVDQDYNDQPWS